MGSSGKDIQSLKRLIKYAHDESKDLEDGELSKLLMAALNQLNLQEKQDAAEATEMRLEKKNKKG